MTKDEELAELRNNVVALEGQVRTLTMQNEFLEQKYDELEVERDTAQEKLEELELNGDPCKDGFHYIAQYGPSGGIGPCKYCGARDDGAIINYATLDPMAFPMPSPMRKTG